MIALLLIAVSLALDAFAVSVSSGIAIPGFGWRQAVRMGIWFGLFQFLMPLMGWLLGAGISALIMPVDHWIAFGLLVFIGGRMVWEALGLKKAVPKTVQGPAVLSAGRLAVLAVATSIDALAVGVSMAFMGELNILAAALLTGGVAFALSVVGGFLGRRLGGFFQQKAQVAGGIVLIAIGAKILCDHILA